MGIEETHSLLLAPVAESRVSTTSETAVGLQASIKEFRQSRERDGPSAVSASTFWREDCTLQFSSPVYLVDENSEEVILDVIRVGPTDSRCQVEVTTVGGSAQEGEAFRATQVTLTFEPQETLKSVHVELFDNENWGTHTEFSAKLGEPMGAVLGEYLSETHVKIIDPGRPVRRGPRPTWNLKFTTTRPTDSIWHHKDDDGRRAGQPLGLQTRDVSGWHWLHYLAPTWRVAGLSRRVLQHGVLSAFLIYNEESRNLVDNGQIVMAMVYDVPNLVNNGYMNVVNLVNAAGKVLIILAFQIFVPPLMGKRPTLLGLGPALFIPCITYFFLRCRTPSQTHTLRDAENKDRAECDKSIDQL
eukprot:g2141.t1